MKLFLKRAVFALLIVLLVSPALVSAYKQIEEKTYFGDVQGEILSSPYFYYDVYSYDVKQRKYPDDDYRVSYNAGISQIATNPNNSDEYIGVYFESSSAKSICTFSRDQRGREFTVEKKILTIQHTDGAEFGLVYAPQFIPNSNAISFKKDGLYWIYNLDDQTTTPIEIENAYSLVWLDDHTFLYTVSTVERLNFGFGNGYSDVSIRKHDLETNTDSLYAENAYGCSLSSNRKFLAYGVAAENNEKCGKIIIQSIDQTQKQEMKNPAPSIYDSPYYMEIWGERYVEPRDGTGAPLTSTRYREWNSVDIVHFQPSPDGKYLVLSSDATYLGHKGQSLIIHCQTGKKIPIRGGFSITSDWVE